MASGGASNVRRTKGRSGDPNKFFEADFPTIMRPDLHAKLSPRQGSSSSLHLPTGGAGDAPDVRKTGSENREREELIKNVITATVERPQSVVNEFNWSYTFWSHIYEQALMKPRTSERDTVILCLPDYIIVEIGLDYSFMVTSYTTNTVISVDTSGSSAAFLHKNGRISQYEKNAKVDPTDRENSRVEGIVVDPRGNEKYFKMWHRGISFSSKHCPLCYLVDQGGVRTTTDVFSDLNYFNSAVYVLFHEQERGPEARRRCFEMVKDFMTMEKQDIQEWKTGPLRISWLKESSEIRIVREDGPSLSPPPSPNAAFGGGGSGGGGNNRIEVRFHSQSGKAALSTSKVRITASDDHLFVRRGNKNQSRYHSCQMHSDIRHKFEVRASGHAAGFNEEGMFTIF